MIKKLLFKNTAFKLAKMTASINLKPRGLVLNQNDKCLCLTPHADDESIGMGGLLSLYPNLFELILLTDGRKGIELPAQEVIKLREEEFKNAMKTAGISKYSFLRAQDKKLLDNFNLFKDISIEEYDYIFIPNILDQHPDHKAVGLLLKRLLAGGAKVKPDLKICLYEVWSALGLVNAFMDISNIIETKKAMINCYKSQTAQKDYEYYALGLNQYRGMFQDKKYAEAFCILSIKDFIKICELY